MTILHEVFRDKYVELIDHIEYVGSYSVGEMYEWDEFHALYDPHTKEYVWLSGAGCSCNWLSDAYHHPQDLRRGPKSAVLNALREYHSDMWESQKDEGQYNRLLEKINKR